MSSEFTAYAVLFNEVMIADDQFKQYLGETRVLQTICEAIVALREESEWPENPKQYICDYLAAHCDAPQDPLAELKETQAKIEQMEKENQELHEKISEYLTAPAEKHSMEFFAPEDSQIESAAFCDALLDPLVELKETQDKIDQMEKENQELHENIAGDLAAPAGKRPREDITPEDSETETADAASKGNEADEESVE